MPDVMNAMCMDTMLSLFLPIVPYVAIALLGWIGWSLSGIRGELRRRNDADRRT